MNRRDARRHRGSHRPPRRRPPDQPIDRRQYWRMRPHAAHAYHFWKQSTVEDPQFVYFVQAREGGPVKIGLAVDPLARLGELQCGNPAELEIAEVILGSKDTEESQHHHWREARLRGEWFGRGYEEAILAIAQTTSLMQIELLADSEPLHNITSLVPCYIARRWRPAA